jgi:hypothetical protein
MKQDLERVGDMGRHMWDEMKRIEDAADADAASVWERLAQEQERSSRLEQRIEALEGAEQRERAKSFEAERVRSEWVSEKTQAHEERIEILEQTLSIIMRERLKESRSRDAWRADVMAALSQVEGGHEAMLAEGARREERQLKIDIEACGCEGAPECQLHYR